MSLLYISRKKVIEILRSFQDEEDTRDFDTFTNAQLESEFCLSGAFSDYAAGTNFYENDLRVTD